MGACSNVEQVDSVMLSGARVEVGAEEEALSLLLSYGGISMGGDGVGPENWLSSGEYNVDTAQLSQPHLKNRISEAKARRSQEIEINTEYHFSLLIWYCRVPSARGTLTEHHRVTPN